VFLPGVLLIVVGYALFYTGVGNLTQGAFTGGNTQGLSTSLGLDALAARAQRATGSGPATTGQGAGAAVAGGAADAGGFIAGGTQALNGQGANA
jgi:hypothetical protein